ncbi:MAG: hypothetical protein SGCHY_002136 [Lobulomycetales sp.]
MEVLSRRNVSPDFDFDTFRSQTIANKPMQSAIYEDFDFEQEFNDSCIQPKLQSYNSVAPESGINVASMSAPAYLSEFSRPHSSEIIREGWLWYARDETEQWKKTFAILTHYQREAVLQLYSKKEDFSPEEVLFLENCIGIQDAHQQIGNPAKYKFQLDMPFKSAAFCTSIFEDCSGWADALQRFVKTRPQPRAQAARQMHPETSLDLVKIIEQIQVRMAEDSADNRKTQDKLSTQIKDLGVKVLTENQKRASTYETKTTTDSETFSRIDKLAKAMEARAAELSDLVETSVTQSKQAQDLFQEATLSINSRDAEMRNIKDTLSDVARDLGHQGSTSKALQESNLFGDTVNQIQDMIKNMSRTIIRQGEQNVKELDPKLDNLVEVTEFLSKTQCKLVDLVTYNVENTVNSANKEPVDTGSLSMAMESLSSELARDVQIAEKILETTEKNALTMKELYDLQHEFSSNSISKMENLIQRLDDTASLDSTEISKVVQSLLEKSEGRSLSLFNEVSEQISHLPERFSMKISNLTNEIGRLVETSSRQSSSPTPNAANELILSMNQKILKLTELCQQMKDAQSGRIQVMEEKIRYLKPQESHGASRETNGKVESLIKSSVDDLEARIGRLSRECSANQDVNQSWFNRVHDLSKNIQKQILESRGKHDQSFTDNTKKVNEITNMVDIVRSHQQKLAVAINQIDKRVDNDKVERSVEILNRAIETQGKKLLDISIAVESLGPKIPTTSDISEVKGEIYSLKERISVLEKMGEDHQDSVMEMKKGINTIIEMMSQNSSEIKDSQSIDPNTESISKNHLVRLTESIHSTLVSYLPMDNSAQLYSAQQTERKLEDIVNMLERGFMQVRHHPTQTTGSRHVQDGYAIVESYHQEVISQGLKMEAQLDSIAASLEKLAGVELKALVKQEKSKGGKPLPLPPQ